MSANAAVVHTSSTVVTRAPWNLPSAAPSVPVRPLVIGEPQPPQAEGPRDFVLPSVIAQRSAAAEQQGFERGFDAGERAGLEAVRLRTEGHFTRLSATIDELRALRAGVLQKSEQDLVRLAVAIAERVLRREVRTNRDTLVAMARAAIRKLGDTHVATISLNPGDHSAVTASPDEPTIRLRADDTLAPGNCVVQSAFGAIDVGIDAQIREILRSLLGDEPDSADPQAQEGQAGDARG